MDGAFLAAQVWSTVCFRDAKTTCGGDAVLPLALAPEEVFVEIRTKNDYHLPGMHHGGEVA